MTNITNNELREFYHKAWNVDDYSWCFTFQNIEMAPCRSTFDCVPFLIPIKSEDMRKEHEFIDEYPAMFTLTNKMICSVGKGAMTGLPNRYDSIELYVEKTDRSFLTLRHDAYYRSFSKAQQVMYEYLDFIIENAKWYLEAEEDVIFDSADFYRKMLSVMYQWDKLDWFALNMGLAKEWGQPMDSDYSEYVNGFAERENAGNFSVSYHFPLINVPYLLSGLPNNYMEDGNIPYPPYDVGKEILIEMRTKMALDNHIDANTAVSN